MASVHFDAISKPRIFFPSSQSFFISLLFHGNKITKRKNRKGKRFIEASSISIPNEVDIAKC